MFPLLKPKGVLVGCITGPRSAVGKKIISGVGEENGKGVSEIRSSDSFRFTLPASAVGSGFIVRLIVGRGVVKGTGVDEGRVACTITCGSAGVVVSVSIVSVETLVLGLAVCVGVALAVFDGRGVKVGISEGARVGKAVEVGNSVHVGVREGVSVLRSVGEKVSVCV